MADRAGEGEPLALVVERLEDEDVGEVHAALERVVVDPWGDLLVNKRRPKQLARGCDRVHRHL